MVFTHFLFLVCIKLIKNKTNILYYVVWRKIQLFSPVSYKSMHGVIFFLKPMVFLHFHKTFLFKQFGSFALGKQTKQWYKRVLVIPDRQCLYAFAHTEVATLPTLLYISTVEILIIAWGYKFSLLAVWFSTNWIRTLAIVRLRPPLEWRNH